MKTVIPKDFLEKINFGKVGRYALYLLVVLILQNIIFTQLRIFGVCPLVLPAVAIAMGMFEGATWGAVFSLFMGIFADMAFIENTVFFTILLPVLSFLAGFVSNFFINRRFFAFMDASAVGLLLTAAAQILKTTASDSFSTVMIITGLLQTLWSLPFAALVYFPPSRLSRLE